MNRRLILRIIMGTARYKEHGGTHGDRLTRLKLFEADQNVTGAFKIAAITEECSWHCLSLSMPCMISSMLEKARSVLPCIVHGYENICCYLKQERHGYGSQLAVLYQRSHLPDQAGLLLILVQRVREACREASAGRMLVSRTACMPSNTPFAAARLLPDMACFKDPQAAAGPPNIAVLSEASPGAASALDMPLADKPGCLTWVWLLLSSETPSATGDAELTG